MNLLEDRLVKRFQITYVSGNLRLYERTDLLLDQIDSLTVNQLIIYRWLVVHAVHGNPFVVYCTWYTSMSGNIQVGINVNPCQIAGLFVVYFSSWVLSFY